MNTERIEDLRNRISVEPNDPALYYKLGKAYGTHGELDHAIRAFRKAIELAPQRTRYHLLLAKTYLKQKKYKHARRQYQHVLSIDPSNIRAHKNLGLIFEFYLRNPQRALAHYLKYSEYGGDDPRVLKRLELVRAELQPAGIKSASDKTRFGDRQDLLQRFLAWREGVATRIANNSENLSKWTISLSMFLIVFLCLQDFPVTDYVLTTVACLVIMGLTVMDVRFGIKAGLILIFFPIAFYNPLMAYLYAIGILLVFRMLRNQNLGSVIAVLLVPLFLQLNVAYVIPLGAAIWLDARRARKLSLVACLAGLGYLLARDLHQLGPLAMNHPTGFSPFKVLPYEEIDISAFFGLKWVKSLFTLKLLAQFLRFARSIYPSIIRPPMVLIEIAAWTLAGYIAARLYQRRTLLHLAFALGAVAGIMFLQGFIIEALFNIEYFPSEAVVKCFFYSGIGVSLLWFFKVGEMETEEEEDISATTTAAELEDVSWDSIGGLESVKKEIQMVTRYQFEQGFSRFTRRFGLKGTKGILFYGPPGCGKTLFAKVLAKDVGASFFSVKGSDFRSKWYGESEQNLSTIFETAREKAPSIIFFDEIESMLEKRGGDTPPGAIPEREILAQFLAEMDGVKPLRGVLIVGATNEPDSIDPAALRPGRFDKLIYIPLPDARGREKIFRVHLKSKPLGAAIDYGKLAKMTERFSGADIGDVCAKVAEQAMQDSLRLGQTTTISMHALVAQIESSKPSVSLESLKRYQELHEKYNRRTIKDHTSPAEEKARYTWEHIGGLENVKQELIEAIETPLKKPHLYQKYKIAPPKGVLLYGPPGCGKTLMAKIVASQCGAHFLSVDMKKETDEGIRKWFIRARENRPSILFFDEIDSIAASRDMGFVLGQGVVQQLLVELDGLEDLKQVVVMAATNRPDRLDGAIMRPGRLDRLIYIPPPDETSRLEILKINLMGKPVAEDVSLKTIAEKTENYSGADLSALCYEASMSLIRESDKGHSHISMADISRAMAKVKSSLNPEELLYFDEMKARYSRG